MEASEKIVHVYSTVCPDVLGVKSGRARRGVHTPLSLDAKSKQRCDLLSDVYAVLATHILEERMSLQWSCETGV